MRIGSSVLRSFLDILLVKCEEVMAMCLDHAAGWEVKSGHLMGSVLEGFKTCGLSALTSHNCNRHLVSQEPNRQNSCRKEIFQLGRRSLKPQIASDLPSHPEIAVVLSSISRDFCVVCSGDHKIPEMPRAATSFYAQ